MIDEATLAQMNGEYVMPPDAGPAWRAAHAAGIDMSLIEDSLRQTPEQRLAATEAFKQFAEEAARGGITNISESGTLKDWLEKKVDWLK